jgi:phospholipase C
VIFRPTDHSDRLRRGELADEAELERALAADPEGTLRRREFLGRTAALAGATTLASILPAEQLVAEAAKRQIRRKLPRPSEMPLDTFVVLMMENRSFDHYFGWHPKADGRNTGLQYPDIDGNLHPTHHLTPDYQGCGHPDPDHGWDGGRHQWGKGKMDGFYRGNEEGTGSDEFAIGYYLKEDVPFIPHAADGYTLYDRWFCSIMASTYPNRHYQWGAQNGGQKSNEFPINPDLGFTWETIFDRAEANGLSVGYYASDLPFAALYGLRGIAWTRRIEQFYVDAALGNLPNICFVDPPFRDGGGGNGLSADEHPHGDIRLGQAFMSDIAHAFMESPQYQRGALFIDYDEWGGFFDHVRPPFVPDDRSSKKLYENYSMCGFRVPGVVISPWTTGGRVSHMQVTFESILKLISYRFRLGHLNKRHRYATNIGRTFRWDKPVLEPQELPDPATVAATPCALQGAAAQSERGKPHDLTALETTGYLERLGYEVPDATLDRILRAPDTVRRAIEAGNEAGAATEKGP